MYRKGSESTMRLSSEERRDKHKKLAELKAKFEEKIEKQRVRREKKRQRQMTREALPSEELKPAVEEKGVEIPRITSTDPSAPRCLSPP